MFNYKIIFKLELRLNTILLNLINKYVPIGVLWRSLFPIWATYDYERLVFKKRAPHKIFKLVGSLEDQYKFSLWRAQVKTESKRT